MKQWFIIHGLICGRRKSPTEEISRVDWPVIELPSGLWRFFDDYAYLDWLLVGKFCALSRLYFF